MGAPPKKTGVIRGGIDLEHYNPANVSGDEIRKQYGIAKDDIVLFFMGWLYHFSGLKEVTRELAKVKNQYSKIKLFIVGDGDAFNDLVSLRRDYHLEGQMILAGKQPYERIPHLIAAADICLLPAYDNEIMHNIVPIKMYEYMAMGKPIIATKLYGVEKEFGTDQGLIYAENPKNVLYKAIELSMNRNLLKEGKKAKKFVEKSSWNNIVEQFEKLLKNLI
jgi:glycosyltransferase involved in cell wall biosynthesis